MQNRYAGDAGDFGKIGLLRSLARAELKVGVNWYLVADEAHNEDGCHTGYLHDPKFVGCDDELLGKLGCMVYGNQRNVQTLQHFELIPCADYYCEELVPPVGNRDKFRNVWHQSAKRALQKADIVFLDPDNGLLPKSVSPNSTKSVKYVLQQEIMDYYVAGYSVVFYNHRWRMDEECYLKQFLAFFQSPAFHGAHIMGLKYVRGTVRDYFFLIQPRHFERVGGAIETMLSGGWSHHFKRLPIMQPKMHTLISFHREKQKRKHQEYTRLLETIHDYALNGTVETELFVGNTMRRVLEAFSTFLYRKGIADISRDQTILSEIDEDKRIYFQNLMYKLVLNGESHYEEHIQGLQGMEFFSHLSSTEKQRTARDILCFIYLLNRPHIMAHLSLRAESDILGWLTSITPETSPT